MANIAQTVNVLQSVALTDNEKMLLTPTYYAFKFYTVHHDSMLLPVYYKSPDYSIDTNGRLESLKAVSCTASKNESGGVNITLTNIDPEKPQEIEINLTGECAVKTVSSQILTADKFTAHNTFEKNDSVKPQDYDGCIIKDGRLIVKLAPKSIVLAEINK
jgi:alpha-N-arabinofuranosidase